MKRRPSGSPFILALAALIYIPVRVRTTIASMKMPTITRVAVFALIAVMTACGDGATPPSSAPSSSTSTPRISTTTTTAAPIVRDDWELVYLDIWDEYESAQNLGSFPFVLRLGPTVNMEKAEESIAAYEKGMKLWLATLDGLIIRPVVWAIMSENDYSWWKDLAEQQEGPGVRYNWDPTTQMFGHCQLSSRAFCGYGMPYHKVSDEYALLQYNVIGSEYMGLPNPNTVNHESVHFYQFGVVERFPDDTPCWLLEGQASLYGNVLQDDIRSQRAASIAQRENFKGIVRRYQPQADVLSADEWVTVLEHMYSPDVSCGSSQDYFKYAVGLFNWEFLYAEFGPAAMHRVFLEFANGASFEEGIASQLGSTVDELNRALADHLVHIFANGH